MILSGIFSTYGIFSCTIYSTITYIFLPKNNIYFAHLYVLFMYVFTYRPYHRHHATIERYNNAIVACCDVGGDTCSGHFPSALMARFDA